MTPQKIIMKNPRVRMAPSPTGRLHIGTARTALFNWLVAKKYGGTFILRIEDTDLKRSTLEFENEIIENLRWLGIDWGEGVEVGGKYGPYRQTERIDLYEKYLRQLVGEKRAYYCFCTEDELEVRREDALARGEVFSYDGRCGKLSEQESAERIVNNNPYVIRFKMPDKKFIFNDLIRGTVEFDGVLIGDQVIAKDFRTPLYNFAVVIDDHFMKITHVIRGEDHLSNTPKQIALYEAFGWDLPQFGHLPLILAPDRSKMSKRFGDVAVDDYRKEGYLPEALFNFMVFLGWHPEEKIGQSVNEMITKEEIVEQFELGRVQKAGAIFNVEKLDWLNGEFIKRLPIDDLIERSIPFLEKSFGKEIINNPGYLKKILTLHQDRIKKLSDLPALINYFFELPDYSWELLKWKDMDRGQLDSILDFLYNKLSSLVDENFTKQQLEVILMPEAEKRGRGELLWPLRVSLSGFKTSAGPFEIMEILGRSESLNRLAKARQKILQ